MIDTKCILILSLQIHHDLAKYHEIGRFVKEESEIDMDAALFHEQHAAELGIKEATIAMAFLHLGMPHDVLSNMTLPVSCSPLFLVLNQPFWLMPIVCPFVCLLPILAL